MVLEGL